MKQSPRTRRIGEMIAHEMSSLLMTTRLEPSPGLVTITGCEVSLDLRIAKVYYSAFGVTDSWTLAAAALEHAKHHLRREIAHRLDLRHTPELVFTADHSIEEGAKIERLLREGRTPEPPKDPEPNAGE